MSNQQFIAQFNARGTIISATSNILRSRTIKKLYYKPEQQTSFDVDFSPNDMHLLLDWLAGHINETPMIKYMKSYFEIDIDEEEEKIKQEADIRRQKCIKQLIDDIQNKKMGYILQCTYACTIDDSRHVHYEGSAHTMTSKHSCRGIKNQSPCKLEKIFKEYKIYDDQAQSIKKIKEFIEHNCNKSAFWIKYCYVLNCAAGKLSLSELQEIARILAYSNSTSGFITSKPTNLGYITDESIQAIIFTNNYPE